MKRREFPARVKLAAWERAGGRCENCSRKLYPGDMHYDHAIPDGSGGEPVLDNCAVLCRSCHGAKTRRDMVAVAKGKRVQQRHLGIKRRRTIRAWRNFRGEIVRAKDEAAG